MVLCFDLLTRPKMSFKVMHRKEVIHSNGSYERKSRGQKLANEMGQGKKIPLYSHRLTHRKRVTSELHDSYFRLMTIKHSISKIKWASNDYIIQLSSTSQCSWQWQGQLAVEFRPESLCFSGDELWWESHTRPNGGSEKMLIRCNIESHHTAE